MVNCIIQIYSRITRGRVVKITEVSLPVFALYTKITEVSLPVLRVPKGGQINSITFAQ